MKTVKFTKPFGFALNGFETTHFQAGDVLSVSASCADSAVQAGAAEYAEEASGESEAPGEEAQKPRGKGKRSRAS